MDKNNVTVSQGNHREVRFVELNVLSFPSAGNGKVYPHETAHLPMRASCKFTWSLVSLD